MPDEVPNVGQMSPNELMAFLQNITRDAELGRQVAARRPQRHDLGELLGSWAELFDLTIQSHTLGTAIRELERGPEEAEMDPDAWVPAPTSTAQQEMADLTMGGWPAPFLEPGHERDSGRTLILVRRLVEAAIDHLRGIAVLMTEARVTRPPIVLGRVVLDGAAHVHHLLDPACSAEERLVRTLNEELSALGASYQVASRDGDAGEVDRLGEEIEEILTTASTRNLSTKWVAARPGKRRDLPVIATRASTADMIGLALDNPGPIWNTLSTIVHNQEDLGFRLVLGLTSRSDDAPQRDSLIAFNVLPSVLVMTRVREVLAAHTGWDFSESDEASHLLARLWAAGSGLDDERYWREVREENDST